MKVAILLCSTLLVSCMADVLEEYTDFPEANMSYKVHMERKLWIDAKLKCFEEGGELALPKNQKQFDELKKIILAIPTEIRGSSGSLWLGFHDIFEEGEYVDLKGRSIQYYHDEWAYDSPNNLETQNCGSMWYPEIGLDDQKCQVTYGFICQKGNQTEDFPLPNYDRTYECPDGLEKCYKLHTSLKTWSQARSTCVAEGGNLAVVRSKQQEDFMVELMKRPRNQIFNDPLKEDVFIGFHDIYKSGLFTTVYDEDIKKLKYFNGHSMKGCRYENCGSLRINGGLNLVDCGYKTTFICERDITQGAGVDVRFNHT